MDPEMALKPCDFGSLSKLKKVYGHPKSRTPWELVGQGDGNIWKPKGAVGKKPLGQAGLAQPIQRGCGPWETIGDPEPSKLGSEKTYAPKDVEVRLRKTYQKT